MPNVLSDDVIVEADQGIDVIVVPDIMSVFVTSDLDTKLDSASLLASMESKRKDILSWRSFFPMSANSLAASLPDVSAAGVALRSAVWRVGFFFLNLNELFRSVSGCLLLSPGAMVAIPAK